MELLNGLLLFTIGQIALEAARMLAERPPPCQPKSDAPVGERLSSRDIGNATRCVFPAELGTCLDQHGLRALGLCSTGAILTRLARL